MLPQHFKPEATDAQAFRANRENFQLQEQQEQEQQEQQRRRRQRQRQQREIERNGNQQL